MTAIQQPLDLKVTVAGAIWAELQSQAKYFVAGNPMTIEQVVEIVDRAAERVLEALKLS